MHVRCLNGIMAGPARWLALCATAWLAGPAAAREVAPRFIFASSPVTHNVVWAELPTFHDLTTPSAERAVKSENILIDGQASKCSGAFCTETSDQGLRTPQGLAVYHGDGEWATLYVSDTEAQNIYSYHLTVTDAVSALSSATPSVSNQVKVAEGVTAIGLAVDGYGNLFYTTTDGKVAMLGAQNMTDAATAGTRPEAQVLYQGGTDEAVAGPGGIAADNFYLYWANQQGGETSGSVARAPERKAAAQSHPPAAVTQMTDQYQVVAQNVCLARDTVFFTGETSSLFAVKTTGGAIAEVNQNFTKPHGCVYDEESTLYVADEGANAIFALPANFVNLRTVSQVSKFMNANGPSQLAVLNTWSVK